MTAPAMSCFDSARNTEFLLSLLFGTAARLPGPAQYFLALQALRRVDPRC